MRTKMVNLLLCVSLIFSLLVGYNVHAQTASTEDYGTKAFEFLQAVGMLDSDSLYEPEQQMDRGLFAKLAVGFSGQDVNNDDVSDFEDIERSEYRQYIIAAHKRGYISGVDKTHFAPDAAITYEQAVKILITMLGYEPIARENGGYPRGYMKVAAECDMLKNTASGDSLSMRDALILLYNAAHTDVMELKPGGKLNTYAINEGETFLVKNFEIYMCEGVIDATAYTELLAQSSGLGRNEVSINGLVFDAGDTNAEEYLGYYVTLYYDASYDRAAYKALYVDVNEKRNTSVVFEDMQNIYVDGNTVRCYEGSTYRKMSVSPTASFIKNGKLSAMSVNDLENIEKGRIELISNDKDKIADVVRVTEYETYVVSNVSDNAGIITTIGGDRIDLEVKSDDCDTKISRNGESIPLSEITSETVILIAASEGKGRNLKNILVGTESVNGTVRRIDTDNVTIDQKTYKADRNIPDSISIGKVYSFKTDALGYIAYARPENDIVYGYIFKIWIEDGEEIAIRVFTENNRWVELYFNDTVKLNGKKEKKETAYEQIQGVLNDAWSRMIRYTVDEKARLRSIDTAQSVKVGSALEAAAIDKDIFRKTISANSTMYKSGAKSFGGKFFVDSSTKIFLIPSDLDMNNFGMAALSDLVNDKSDYNVIAYDTDKYLTAKAMIILDNKKSIGLSSKMMVVDGTGGSILNEDDEPVPMIKGFWKGDLVSLPVKIGEKYVKQSVLDGLKRGDIIQFTYDNGGNVISIVHHKSDNDGNWTYGTMTSSYAVIGGKVEHCSSGKINLNYNENGDKAGVALNTSTAIYLYEKQYNTLRVCDWTEILKGDKIMAVLSHLVCREIIIIRE